MKKKQFLALALSVVMAGGMLAGCGNTASTTTDNGRLRKQQRKQQLFKE